MRIWDINPGYLNDHSLLGEHRELHAIVSILTSHKQGYSRHPETLRWKGYGWALYQRHRLLRAEMTLRRFREVTPVRLRANKDRWPTVFIDTPGVQYKLLGKKYVEKMPGRIPLPHNAQQLWAQHKYSMLARDPVRYQVIGEMVAGACDSDLFCDLALELTNVLRTRPYPGRLENAVQHMWGYVSEYAMLTPNRLRTLTPRSILLEIQRLARQHNQHYLLASTALSELEAWL